MAFLYNIDTMSIAVASFIEGSFIAVAFSLVVSITSESVVENEVVFQ